MGALGLGTLPLMSPHILLQVSPCASADFRALFTICIKPRSINPLSQVGIPRPLKHHQSAQPFVPKLQQGKGQDIYLPACPTSYLLTQSCSNTSGTSISYVGGVVLTTPSANKRVKNLLTCRDMKNRYRFEGVSREYYMLWRGCKFFIYSH